MRVLGVDPGLTRCGVGVVDVAPNRTATLVHVAVIRTSPEQALEHRLLDIGRALAAVFDEFEPEAFALERVFAQHNVRTVMGIAQISGIAMQLAADRGVPVGLHTPSEVKAAITGYGAADKKQVTTMVTRVLRLAVAPTPADAADALAIAICHAWRGAPTSSGGAASAAGTAGLTPAQRAWQKAERSARRS